MTSLINLKKAEHWNNKLFVYCFRYCLACSHLSKANLPLSQKKREGKQNMVIKIYYWSEIVCPKISLRVRKTTVCKACALVAPDGTDSKKTKKWGCSWNAFDRMSLKMTQRILWSQCSLGGPFLKSFIWSGLAARKSRLISVLTFGNENGGVAKGIEFSGSIVSCSRSGRSHVTLRPERLRRRLVARRLATLAVLLKKNEKDT